jgi:hypothetical protein
MQAWLKLLAVAAMHSVVVLLGYPALAQQPQVCVAYMASLCAVRNATGSHVQGHSLIVFLLLCWARAAPDEMRWEATVSSMHTTCGCNNKSPRLSHVRIPVRLKGKLKCA